MPHRWSRLVALGALACVLAVSGCVGAEPSEPSPSPTASAEPVFASEQEALAAATEVYEGYTKVGDQIAADGGTEVNRLAPFVTDAQLQQEDSSYGALRDRSLVGVGAASFDSVRLQDFRPDLAANDTLNVYLCSDITRLRLFDASGADVTPPDRTDRLPLLVSFLLTEQDERPLLIDGSDTWSGDNFC